MKFSNIEGTPEEITNLFQNNGLKFTDYFVAPEPKMKLGWLIVPAFLACILAVVLVLGRSRSEDFRNVCFTIFCLFLLWSAIAVQIRFKSAWATGLVVIGGLLVGMVALGELTPMQLLEQAKSLKSNGKS